MLIYLDQCYRDKRLSAIKISDKFLLAISVEESFVRDRLERFFFLSRVETLNRMKIYLARKLIMISHGKRTYNFS